MFEITHVEHNNVALCDFAKCLSFMQKKKTKQKQNKQKKKNILWILPNNLTFLWEIIGKMIFSYFQEFLSKISLTRTKNGWFYIVLAN